MSGINCNGGGGGVDWGGAVSGASATGPTVGVVAGAGAAKAKPGMGRDGYLGEVYPPGPEFEKMIQLLDKVSRKQPIV